MWFLLILIAAVISIILSRPHRFVVFKGSQGFGDRLQCFLQVIRYAKVTDRILVLDWRDSDWSHQPEKPMSDFFEIQGVRSMPLNTFLDVYAKSFFSVVPDAWCSKMHDPNFENFIYDTEYILPDDNQIVDAIVQSKKRDFKEDVVVYPGVGTRTYAYSDASAIKLHENLDYYVKLYAGREGLQSKEYDVVHLRGGSKTWMGGVVPLQSLDQQIKGLWPTAEAYLHDLHSKYNTAVGQSKEKALYLMSDSKELLNMWIETYSVGKVLGNFNSFLEESGIHKIKPQDLEARGVNKMKLNYEMLRDFAIMLNARFVISDGVSTFSVMASSCNQAGVTWVQF